MLSAFIIVGLVLSLGAALLVVRPLLAGTNSSPWAAVMTAVLLPVAVAAGYLGVSNHAWLGEPERRALEDPTVREAIADLEARLAENPGDEDGWLVLGDAYVATGRYNEAGIAYQRALNLSGGDNVMAMLGVAEAMIFVDRNAMAGEAGRLIEEALQREPANAKGLWYGGLAALSRNEPGLARQRWQGLLDLDPPAQVRAVLERELANLAAAGEGSGVLPPMPGAVPDGEAARVGVRVRLASELGDRVRDDAYLFIVLRDSDDREAPPLAVVRHAASELPAEFWISDADVMLPGRSLEGLSSGRLIARVANGGDATARPGDVFGEASWQPGESDEDPVEIVIDQVVQP